MDRPIELEAPESTAGKAARLELRATDRLQRVLLAFLIYSAFEGLLKRLTGFAWYIYPIKDLFFLIVLFHWAALRPSGGTLGRTPFTLLLVFYLSLVAVQALNPHLPTYVMWLAGVRTSYMYVLLYFVAYRAFCTEERIVRLAIWLGALAVITALGAMVESLLGLEWVYRHRLQVFVEPIYLGASGNWVIRPSSIANGPGSAAMVEYFGAIALFGLAVREKMWLRRMALLGATGLALAGVLLSAVRIVWVQAAVAIVAFVLLAGRLPIRRAAFVLVPAGVAVVLSLFFSRGEIAARFQTVETPADTYITDPSAAQRYSGLLALPRVVAEFPLGAGVGWNAPRQDLLVPYRGQEMLEFAGIHNYLSVLAMEVGVLGLLVLLLFSLGISYRGLVALLQQRNSERQSLQAAYYALFVSLLLSFLVGGGLVGWPGEYYWIFAAIIIRLGQLKSEGLFSTQVARSSQRSDQ